MSDFSAEPEPPPITAEPPPLPVIALQYASPASAAVNRGQQLAAASWSASVLLWVLAIFSGIFQRAGSRSPITKGVLGVIAITLIIGGLICGILALMGMGQWGRKRVMAPAITGVILNGLILALVVLMIPATMRAKAALQAAANAQVAAAQAAQAARDQKQSDSFYQPGWFGVYKGQDVTVTLACMPDDSPVAADLQAAIPQVHHFANVAVMNHSKHPVTLDTRRAIIYLGATAHEPAIDPLATMRSAIRDRDELLRECAPPYRAEPGQTVTRGLFFFRYGTNFTVLSRVTLWLDGHAIDLDGRIFSTAEKKRLIELGQQSMSGALKPRG